MALAYLPSLDVLRALAALTVVAFHFRNVLPFGWMGVQFFFVLSGFLITAILRHERTHAGGLSAYTRRFYLRRCLRLLPLYFFYLLLITVTAPHREALHEASPYLLSQTYNLARAFGVVSPDDLYIHLWSLNVEWQFYLLWPFVVWAVGPAGLRRVLVLLLVAGPAVRLLQFELTPPGPLPVALQIYLSSWTYVDSFALGGLLSFDRTRDVLARPGALLATLACAAGGGVAVLLSGEHALRTLGYPVLMPSHFQLVWGYTVVNVASAAVLASVVAGRVPEWLLRNQFLRYLGTISYGIYVYHLLAIAVVERGMRSQGAGDAPWETALGLLASAALATAMAAASFALVERPFLRFKERTRRGPPSGPPAASTSQRSLAPDTGEMEVRQAP